jgi:hypothetical protein
MRPKMSLAVVLLCAACAHPSGNYTQIGMQDSTKLVQDSVQQIKILYPPASTHFRVGQSTADGYGTALMQQLRTEGYALEEKPPWFPVLADLPASKDQAPLTNTKAPSQVEAWLSELPNAAKQSAIAAIPEEAPAPSASSKMTLSYLLDPLMDGMVRVSLTVNQETLSRVYAHDDQTWVSAGAWTRKE